MKRWMLGLAVVVVVVAGGSGANAAIITSSVVVDLRQTTIADDGWGGKEIWGIGSTLVPVSSFTPQVGDTLLTTVTFMHGDRLKIIDGPNAITHNGPPYWEGLTFYFDGWSGVSAQTFTTDVTFYNLQGSQTIWPPGYSCVGVLGQNLGMDFTDNWLSFTGLTMTTEIQALPNPGVQSYDQFGLFGGRAGGFEVISGTAAVPEPSTLVIFSSLGVMGSVMGWRKRKRVA